ncbi:glutamate-cysteine ligase family protein [Stieleria sp. TO1_6]|uniref:carboxylate-amine ligase n=1 Tax=Stieleria tagensis TaxID=2956795 RepID=UPI00209AD4B6|nr:glutamate-cysteine ligase family protein [Stieleria tagensis]MCO8121851.1 glutamate-cysteine ligase family protein [Stieleria tagensis]
MNTQPLGLFDAVGIEMEYMIVDRDTLDVRPIADVLLSTLAGGQTVSDFTAGPITWSNELALHVLELKTTHPAKRIRSLPSQFETAIRDLRPTLDQLDARLLPTAMHPWMNPAKETVLWPHENHDIYQAYDRVFDCRSHGWANVQSVHLNLPFDGDHEFALLHAAVRLVLPILPALAASSPIVGGSLTGQLDSRLHHYAGHCDRVPALIGNVIPEPIFDESDYRRQIFVPIQDAIAAHDPEGVFEVDFLNARGAIARFDRGSIELRLMDVQEYPAADVAICAAVTAVIKRLVQQQTSTTETQQSITTEQLRGLLDAVATTGEQTLIDDSDFLACFGIERPQCRAGELWSLLLQQARRDDESLDSLYAPIEIILSQGTLATRIRNSLGPNFSHEELHNVYDQLADCLDLWEPFHP